ncbi:MAG: phosphopantetheine adenylyltransferase [Phycisphaerae bacterium SM23_30]|nr:MAG: phosphopantetheine adenylyltransferase [Phycisphaerae bacterium SM23_30]
MPTNKFVRAVFPGSFDPITNAHLDVVRRSVKIFDELIIGVGDNPAKDHLFTGPERREMIDELIKDMPEVKVECYSGLTVEYVRSKDAQVIVRGLRNLMDVQYEFQLALINRTVAGIETVFIMTDERFGFTSSTLIQEVGRFGGDVSGLLPPSVYEKLQIKLKKSKNK